MYGTFLRQVRTSRHLTQAQLAETSGISQPNISAYENDRRMPTLEVLNRILVSCGYLLSATAGAKVITAPLPRVGWFPDEDRPSSGPDEPYRPAGSPTVEQRGEIAWEVLELADAIPCS